MKSIESLSRFLSAAAVAGVLVLSGLAGCGDGNKAEMKDKGGTSKPAAKKADDKKADDKKMDDAKKDDEGAKKDDMKKEEKKEEAK